MTAPLKIFFWYIDYGETNHYSFLTISGEIEIADQDGIKFLHPRSYQLSELNLEKMEATTIDNIKIELSTNDESEIDYFWIDSCLKETNFMTKIVGHISPILDDWSITICEQSWLILESPVIDKMAQSRPGFVGYRSHGEGIKIAIKKLDLSNMMAYTYRTYPNGEGREIEMPLGIASKYVNIDLIKSVKTLTEIVS